MKKAMNHAREAELGGHIGNIPVIDELGRAGIRKWSMNENSDHQISCLGDFYMDPGESWVTCDQLRRWQRNFIGLAVSCRLLSYLEEKVKADRSLVIGQHDTPLILYAFSPEIVWPEMVTLLLRYGADPNQLWFGHTHGSTL
jgi:hypothetical protein